MVNGAKLIIHIPYFRHMRYYLAIFTFVVLGCQNTPQQTASKGPVEIFRPEYAKGFEIHHFSDKTSIILFDLQNIGDTLEIIEISKSPAQQIACLSTTHLSYLDRLNALETVKGVAFGHLVRNQNALLAIENKKMVDLSDADDVSMELLLSIKPEWFTVYPYGHDGYEKYTSKGIKCLPISEYLETHPLGRAEWIKVFGELCGKSQEANAVFANIKNEYNKTQNLVANTANLVRPCVFTGSQEAGTWYAPPANSFVGTWISDAGAQYVLADSTSNGNLKIPFETLYDLIFNCDYWGRVEYDASTLTFDKIKTEDPRMSKVKAFTQNKIFYCNTSTSDYFGDAVIEPEVILKDLVKIFHPEIPLEHQGKYFISVK